MSINTLENIKNAGVVGAGGAGFPTHVKLAGKAEILLVNAAECEPLIRVDQQLLETHVIEFLEGLHLALELTQATRACIAIKAKHHELVKKLKDIAAEEEALEVAELGDYYPAGDEQILVHDILGKVVPRGGIPLSVGCVVCNVETLINVARAQNGIPVTSSFVTIAGEVPSPATLELPVGVSYREALSLAGATSTEGKSAIDGGPMMGRLIDNLDEPLTKTTKAILLLDSNKQMVAEKSMTDKQILKQSRTACLQCQKCTDLCPRDLLGHDVKPHIIMRIANYGLSDFEGIQQAFGCCECGACALYSCPCGLSPRRVYQIVKQQLFAADIRNDNGSTVFSASPLFDYRKIPVKRLVARLGLTALDLSAPYTPIDYQPAQVSILLKQHLGAPSTAVVKVGHRVRRGDLVGIIDDDKLGANVHASIDGTVTAVSESTVDIARN